MRSVSLGGRPASVVGLGFWQFGSPQWGWGEDLGEAAAKDIVRRALDLGINLFDTAEIYGNGRSEEILGSALGERREEAVIASKVSPMHLRGPSLKAAAERSLQRLGAETIDLYQAHWPNRFVPQGSTMGAMRELLESGKVRAVGVSNYPLDLWRRAEKALGGPVVSNQVEFHLLDPRPLADLVPHARENSAVVIAYSPLAQGALGGRYAGANPPSDFRRGQPLFSSQGMASTAPLIEEMQAVGRAHGASVAQIALAWLLHIPQTVVIPGARTLEQVESHAYAAEIQLSEAEWSRLTAAASQVVQPKPKPGLKRLAAVLLGAR